MRRGALSNGRKVIILRTGSWSGLPLSPTCPSAEASRGCQRKAGAFERGIQRLRASWPAQQRTDRRWAASMFGTGASSIPKRVGTERDKVIAWAENTGLVATGLRPCDGRLLVAVSGRPAMYAAPLLELSDLMPSLNQEICNEESAWYQPFKTATGPRLCLSTAMVPQRACCLLCCRHTNATS